MIRRLVLENFRRHQALDLSFDPADQLVLFSGRNGVGKSTILEAITFALYGEGRHGRRNLGDLTRRGAELEGMSVELEIDLSGELYRVHRRRDGKASTAVLYGNGIPLFEGPVPVTEEVCRLLGMDAAGFRVAVIAQQKDIDGLASLRPAERAAMLSRLLRLDVVTAARDQASVLLRSSRDAAAALRSAVDAGTLADALRDAVAERESALGELARARAAVAALQARIAEGGGVEQEWAAASQALARAEGEASACASVVARLEEEVSALGALREVPAPQLGDLADRATALERSIAHGEAAARAADQRALVLRELDRVRGEQQSGRQALDGPWPDPVAARRGCDVAEGELLRAREDVEGAAAVAARSRSLRDAAVAALSTLEGVGALCDSCGQQVSDQYREGRRADLEGQVGQCEEDLAKALLAVDAARVRASQAQQQVALLSRELGEAERAADRRSVLLDSLVELDRRQVVLEGQLERLPDVSVDLDELYAAKASLALEADALRRQEDAHRRWLALSQQRAALDSRLAAARDALDRARQAVQQAGIPDELGQRHARHAALHADLAAEAQLEAHWVTAVAVAVERVAHRQSALEDAQALEQVRQQRVRDGVEAGAAARLLDDVADHLAARIRPALQGAVSALLVSMSEGRFTQVEIDDEYAIKVVDDGAPRDLGSLSGGEVDLVALAVRLALAQVVAEQHGAAGCGFLILDECFGSQDVSRRGSILSALRAIRSVYPQVFLISHVDSIEDAVDRVVEVSASDDRSETLVVMA